MAELDIVHRVRVDELARLLAKLLAGAPARVERMQPLAAAEGAWLALDVVLGAGAASMRHALVLRAASDGDTTSVADRHALLEAAYLAEVRVAEPLGWCDDESILGRPFHVVRRLAGVSPDGAWPAAARVRLVSELGATLARLHRIAPPWPGLEFLEEPAESAALARVGELRWQLDRAQQRLPALEWGLRWLERNAPPPGRQVLGHGGLRASTCLATGGSLSGVVDWGRARWSEPLEDVAALTADGSGFERTRGAAADDDVLAPLVRGYEAEAGTALDLADLPYWEVMAIFARLVDGVSGTSRVTARELLDALSRLEAVRSLTAVARQAPDARARIARARGAWLAGFDTGATPCGEIERFATLYGEDLVAASAGSAAERLGAMNQRFARDIRDGTFDGACAQAARVQLVAQLRELIGPTRRH